MILIGSRALNHYMDLNRPMHDWDFIMDEYELTTFDSLYKHYKVKETNYSIIYDIQGNIVEIRNPKNLDPTDKELLELNQYCGEFYTETPFLCRAVVPKIQFLYDIKKSTKLCIDEPKHSHDLNLIEKHFDIHLETNFFKRRLAETKERTDKSNKVKYDFFHKYHIPEYVLHDRLHDMIADLLDMNYPTYKRITVADTDISEELFNKLTHEQKISLMMEESLVLNLERWFIPQMVENGINYRLIDKFYNNNEAMPTYLILKHVCVKGLKGEADYITKFSRLHFFEIEKEWIKAKEKIKSKKGFPTWFFNELFELRKQYKQGNKVGIK
jgi:hypothetical protein